MYIPPGCTSEAEASHCSLHVAFHGCKQTVPMVGSQFYLHVRSGWAVFERRMFTQNRRRQAQCCRDAHCCAENSDSDRTAPATRVRRALH